MRNLRIQIEGTNATLVVPVGNPFYPDTAERISRIASKKKPARLKANMAGLHFEWEHDEVLLWVLPHWRTWWRNRRTLEGVEALDALKAYGAYVARRLGRELVRGAGVRPMRLAAALRDFPPLIRWSPEIQDCVATVLSATGRLPRPERGEPGRENRLATLHRLLDVVNRVEEVRRRMPCTVLEACKVVARQEAHTRKVPGRDPTEAIRRDYYRGRGWYARLGLGRHVKSGRD